MMQLKWKIGSDVSELGGTSPGVPCHHAHLGAISITRPCCFAKRRRYFWNLRFFLPSGVLTKRPGGSPEANGPWPKKARSDRAPDHMVRRGSGGQQQRRQQRDNNSDSGIHSLENIFRNKFIPANACPFKAAATITKRAIERDVVGMA